MGYTTYNPSMPSFVGDLASLDQYPGGLEIEWADVPATAKYQDQDGKQFVKAGTLMAQHPTTKKIAPHQAAATGYSAVVGHLVSNAHKESKSDAITGYGVYTAGNIYENMLPEYLDAWWAATGKTASAALGFKHYLYADNRS